MSIRKIFDHAQLKYKLPGLIIFIILVFTYLQYGGHLNFSPGVDYNRLARDGVLKKESLTVVPTPKISIKLTSKPKITYSYNKNVPTLKKRNANQESQNEDWGVAKKIGENSYTIKVGYDDRMGTPTEILAALNNYRQSSGRTTLTLDDKLASYASSRADYFKSIDKTDEHAGINNFLENEDGFSKLGFSSVGENSYFGGPLFGVHLIEWVFAKSPGHDANQLDSKWTHVGIGTNAQAVNLVFAR